MATMTAASLKNLVDPVFRTAFRGELIAPDDAGYDEARKVYNGMIDRRPGLIAQCVDAADVIAAVGLARQHDLLVSVRCGGHNAGGLGIADGALTIDLGTHMRGVHVDVHDNTVMVEGGARWGDVDHATHPFGLAVPSGIISTTGVGGLTLGGGIGYLARRHGLSLDNLLTVDIVTADGRYLTASEKENPDLFWAVRGGGGNFGVITSFTFQAHPVDMVAAGPMLWHLDRAAEILRWYDGFMQTAPRELGGFFGFLTVPPADPFPAELQLKPMCGVVWCCTEPVKAGEHLKAARELNPALDGVDTMPWPMMQSAFDALYPAGDQWYWKADFVDELSDDAIAAHVEWGSKLPTPGSTMHLYPIDGAVHDTPSDATAFAHRSSRYAEVIVGVDPDPAKTPELTQWARGYFDATHPFSAGGAYVNFMMDDEGTDRIKATYGGNYDRLVELKRKYDPGNLFRVNQNITP